jgi:hypothetical protein
MKYYTPSFLADVYGQNGYGNNIYEGTGCTQGDGTNCQTGGGGSGTLTNTGFDVILAVSLACVIVFAALLTRFLRRPAKKTDSNLPE